MILEVALRRCAEQCGRAVVPAVAPTTTLAEVLKTSFAGERLLFSPGHGGTLPEGRPRAVLLLIGPAGGFEPGELDEAQQAGFRPIGLGPRVLRAETAAIAAVALLQAAWGDLR